MSRPYEEVTIKYRLTRQHEVQTPIIGAPFVLDSDGELTEGGLLRVFEGFGCDGPSGPTVDTPPTILPAVEHDLFYKAFRAGVLSLKLRKRVDVFFRRRLIESGVSRARAWVWYWAVRACGGSSAKRSFQ
jgi:hypothetical protein